MKQLHKDYVMIWDVACELGMQSQYVYYNIIGLANKKRCDEGLRIILNDNYHQIQIHKDDVPELVQRIRANYPGRW